MAPMARNDAEEALLLGARDAEVPSAIRAALGGVLELLLAQRRAMGVFAASLGVTDSDVLALALVRRQRAPTVGSLASDLGLTRGSASLLVTRLEKAGLAVRRPDAEDRRVVHIEVTDDGARVVTRVRDAYVVALSDALEGSEEQLRLTGEVLRSTAGRLRTAAEESARRDRPASGRP
jgi:DNA-binding MarR family transcriptional regulator